MIMVPSLCVGGGVSVHLRGMRGRRATRRSLALRLSCEREACSVFRSVHSGATKVHVVGRGTWGVQVQIVVQTSASVGCKKLG